MKKILLKLLLVILPVVLAGNVYAAGVYVATSGDWKATSTWTGPVASHVPSTGDIAIIPSGVTVTFTVATNLTGGGDVWLNPAIYVYGTLKFLSTVNAAPQYNNPANVYVFSGGKYWDAQLNNSFYMNAIMNIYSYSGSTYLQTPVAPNNFNSSEYSVNPNNNARDFNPTVPGIISSPGPTNSNNPRNLISNTTSPTNPPDAVAVAAIGSANNLTYSSATVAGTVYSSNIATTAITVEYSTSSNFSSFSSVNALPGNILALQNSAVAANLPSLNSSTTYYYRIKATNAAGSTTSDALFFKTPVGPPSGLTASQITATGFKVTWAAANAAASYQLDVSTTNSFSSFVSGYNNAPVSAAQAGATLSGLAADTTYYYRVRTVDAGNVVSVNSSTATQTTDSPPVVAGTVAMQAVNDNSTISPFSSVSITDVDAGQTLTMTITLSGASNGTFTSLNGFTNFNNGVYGYFGLASAVQSAVQGLIFVPTANHVTPGSTETTTFTMAIDDGAGGTVINSNTSVVTTSINDAPVLAGGGTSAYTEAGTAATVAPAITVSDVDNTLLAAAKIAVTGGFLPGDVLLATTSGTNISASYNGATGVLFLTGSDNQANYQKVLRSVTFSNSSLNPTNGGANLSRTISFSASDGNLTSIVLTSTINITAVNQAPVLAGTATVNYSQGGSAVAANQAVTASDVDNTTLASATVSITNGFLSGDVLSANAGATNISVSYNTGTGVLSLTGADSPANYQSVLQTISYSSTSSLPTNYGANPSRTISFTVNDGSLNSGAVTSAVNVTAAPADATLSALTLSVGTLSPGFAGNVTTYTATVANTNSSITITPTISDAHSTVRVNGTATVSGTASAAILLTEGTNTINVLVTAWDGGTQNYTLSITRVGAGSQVAKIKTIILTPASTLTLVPGPVSTDPYNPATVTYTTSVVAGINSVSVKTFVQDPNSTIKVEGVAVAEGVASGDVPLNAGLTVIHISVTAQDGFTTKYITVNVNKAGTSNSNLTSVQLSPASTLTQVSTGTANVNYTASVAAGISQVTLTPKAEDATATIKVAGNAVISGQASAPIPLNGTGSTVIRIEVTGGDGISKRTYDITISRNGASDVDLKTIALNPQSGLTQTTGAANVNYITSVAAGTTTVTVTPTANTPTATIRVEGTITPSGTASGPVTLNNTGSTTINLTVTGGDNQTVRTYSITINRNGSSNAKLRGLAIVPASAVTTPLTLSGHTYSATANSSQGSIKLMPYTTDATATMTVNGVTVASGTASDDIPLITGLNNISIVVTAQDGTTTNSYTIQITRDAAAPSFHSIFTETGIAKKSNDNTTLTEPKVHQAVSPNGDGQNDVLSIDGIENYADNHLSIMNTGGQLIYDTKGYNTGGNVFDGHSSKTGVLQKTGTYYYSLEYKDGNDTKHKTGYIVLKY